MRSLCLRQQLGINLQRCLEALHLARSGIELPGDPVESVLAIPRRVGAFGLIPAQRSVGILVRAGLLRTVGVGKEHGDVGVLVQALVFDDFLALVIGQSFAHRCGDAVQHPTEPFQRGGGAL